MAHPECLKNDEQRECVVSLATGERLKSFPPLNALLAIGYLIVFGSIVAFSACGYFLRRVWPALATPMLTPSSLSSWGFSWRASVSPLWGAGRSGDPGRSGAGDAARGKTLNNFGWKKEL